MKKIFLIILLFASITSKAQKISDTPSTEWTLFPIFVDDSIHLVYQFNHFENFPDSLTLCIKVCDSAMITPCELYTEFFFDKMPKTYAVWLHGIIGSAYGKLYIQCVVSKKKEVLFSSEKQLLIHYTRQEMQEMTKATN